MAIDGFYSVDFSAVLKGAKGIVVVEAGRVRGGDDQYLYSGEVTGADEDLHVKLAVKAYVPGAVTVFNTTTNRFELELTGKVVGTDLQFVGVSPIQGATGITILAHRLDDVSLA